MNPNSCLQITSPDSMQRCAEQLGQIMEPGDVIALIGPLGSGKTTFAQGLAVGLGVPATRHVASPTFALVNEHDGRHPFVHADLYRIARAEEIAELGLEEALDRAVTVIEWADRFPSWLPKDYLNLTLQAQSQNVRLVQVLATGPRSRRLAAFLSSYTE